MINKICLLKYEVIFISVMVLAACSGNVFKEMADKNTDEAKYETANKAIDAGDYDAAIAAIESLSADYRGKTKVIETWAGAYAAKCGQQFVAIVNGLSSSSGAPLKYFMGIFKNITTDAPSCATAQAKMELLGTSTQRTTDQNFFMFLLGISKIGTYLKKNADISPVDGSADAGFSSCSSSSISDADIKQVITGVGLLFENITAIGASISGSSAIASLSSLQATCGAACAITDITSPSLTAPVVNYFREALMASDFGVGSNCTLSQALPIGAGTTCCP